MFHHHHRWASRYAHAYAGCRTYYESRGYESRGRRSGHHGSGGYFGVRRPLRYLTYKLDLDDDQIRSIAASLDRLKVEREQANLDEARTVTDIAGLVKDAGLSVEQLRTALAPRVASAEHLQTAVAKALHEIVDVLDAEQKEDFAYLLNAKAFVL